MVGDDYECLSRNNKQEDTWQKKAAIKPGTLYPQQRPGEMAQQLRVPIALPKDPRSVSSTHIRPSYLSSVGTAPMCTYLQSHTQIKSYPIYLIINDKNIF